MRDRRDPQFANHSRKDGSKCVCKHPYMNKTECTHVCTCILIYKCLRMYMYEYMRAFVHSSCAELYSVYEQNSKHSTSPPKSSQVLTVTQRTQHNTCWDDGGGWQPRQHMCLILALMKTTWHKYWTKRATPETGADIEVNIWSFLWAWGWQKERKSSERRQPSGCNMIRAMHNNVPSQKQKHLSLLWSPQVTVSDPQSPHQVIFFAAVNKCHLAASLAVWNVRTARF